VKKVQAQRQKNSLHALLFCVFPAAQGLFSSALFGIFRFLLFYCKNFYFLIPPLLKLLL